MRLALLAAIAASLAAPSADAKPAAACKPGTLPARVGGQSVCLRPGLACRAAYEDVYRRHRLTCSAGRLRRVPAAPPQVPARVVVDAAGVSSASEYGITYAGYGVVLRNVSPHEDALRVDVLVNVLDPGGAIIKSEATPLVGIPAGATFYVGDSVSWSGPAQAARVEVSVRVRERQRKGIPGLPRISALAWSASGTYSGAARVAGEIGNPYGEALSSLARIGVVCFDAAGRPLGGGFAYPPAAIPSGGRAGFEATVHGVAAAAIGSCRASAEPEVE